MTVSSYQFSFMNLPLFTQPTFEQQFSDVHHMSGRLDMIEDRSSDICARCHRRFQRFWHCQFSIDIERSPVRRLTYSQQSSHPTMESQHLNAPNCAPHPAIPHHRPLALAFPIPSHPLTPNSSLDLSHHIPQDSVLSRQNSCCLRQSQSRCLSVDTGGTESFVRSR